MPTGQIASRTTPSALTAIAGRMRKGPPPPGRTSQIAGKHRRPRSIHSPTISAGRGVDTTRPDGSGQCRPAPTAGRRVARRGAGPARGAPPATGRSRAGGGGGRHRPRRMIDSRDFAARRSASNAERRETIGRAAPIRGDRQLPGRPRIPIQPAQPWRKVSGRRRIVLSERGSAPEQNRPFHVDPKARAAGRTPFVRQGRARRRDGQARGGGGGGGG